MSIITCPECGRELDRSWHPDAMMTNSGLPPNFRNLIDYTIGGKCRHGETYYNGKPNQYYFTFFKNGGCFIFNYISIGKWTEYVPIIKNYSRSKGRIIGRRS